jgi:Ca2+-binding EF-hand superfamily protein
MFNFSDIDLETFYEFISEDSRHILDLLRQGNTIKDIYRYLKISNIDLIMKFISIGEEISLFRLTHINIAPKKLNSEYLNGYNQAIHDIISEVKMGKVCKAETSERRKKVKDLILKGITDTHELAKILDVSSATILEDIKWVNAYYLKLATNNPHIANKQLERVYKMLDELEMVKKEYWDIINEAKIDRTPENKTLVDKLEKTTRNIKYALQQDNEEELSSALSTLDSIHDGLSSIKKKNLSTRLDALKGIVTRVEKEAKVLGLFNPATLIVNNYISKENLQEILEVVRGIIVEFVPDEKKKYAIDRMRSIEIKEETAEDIIDAEVLE